LNEAITSSTSAPHFSSPEAPTNPHLTKWAHLHLPRRLRSSLFFFGKLIQIHEGCRGHHTFFGAAIKCPSLLRLYVLTRTISVDSRKAAETRLSVGFQAARGIALWVQLASPATRWLTREESNEVSRFWTKSFRRSENRAVGAGTQPLSSATEQKKKNGHLRRADAISALTSSRSGRRSIWFVLRSVSPVQIGTFPSHIVKFKAFDLTSLQFHQSGTFRCFKISVAVVSAISSQGKSLVFTQIYQFRVAMDGRSLNPLR
jgi:hypothetical protein